MLSKITRSLQVKQMQRVQGIQTAFCFFANESLISVYVLNYVYTGTHKTNTCVFSNFLLQERA